MPTQKNKTKNLARKLNECSDANCSADIFTREEHTIALNSCKNLPQLERRECMDKHIPDFNNKFTKKDKCEKLKCAAENKVLEMSINNLFESRIPKINANSSRKSKTLKKSRKH